MNKSLRILVLSDIHAYTKADHDGIRPSYVFAGDNQRTAPTKSLLDKSDDVCGNVDLIVCAGDLGDKAEPSALNFAWQFLLHLARKLGDPPLVVATGNHDVDSRLQISDFDPKGNLFSLDPTYPVVYPSSYPDQDELQENIKLNYWARNFAIFHLERARIVVLNSAAYHGYGAKNREFDHGRISSRTLEDLKRQLQQDQEKHGKPFINIIVFHHHLESDSEVDHPDAIDASKMLGAPHLVHLLSDPSFGRWFVIHGHRHHPRIYRIGDAGAPIILSAASFGSTNEKDYWNNSPNQIHLVDLDFCLMKDLQLYPAGSIRSHSYAPGIGWAPDLRTGGLPPIIGFGFTGSIEQLAKTVDGHCKTSVIQWEDLVDKVQLLRACTHDHLFQLRKVLEQEYGLKLVFDNTHNPIQVGKNVK